MGWGSGSSLLSNIIQQVETASFPVVDHDTKVMLYKILIQEFENRDCDTTDECLGESEAFDQAYRELYPDDFDDE